MAQPSASPPAWSMAVDAASELSQSQHQSTSPRLSLSSNNVSPSPGSPQESEEHARAALEARMARINRIVSVSPGSEGHSVPNLPSQSPQPSMPHRSPEQQSGHERVRLPLPHLLQEQEPSDSAVSTMLGELLNVTGHSQAGRLRFTEFARWASWDGQILEWLDHAARWIGTETQRLSEVVGLENVRSRLNKLPLNSLLQVYRADSRRNELMSSEDFSRLLCQVAELEPTASTDSFCSALAECLAQRGLYWIEFGTGVALLCRGTQMEKLRVAFEMLDADSDGLISQQELENFLGMFHRWGVARATKAR